MSTTQTPIWELPDSERPVEGLDEYGDPDPEYAAALGLISAPLPRRAAAVAVDLAVFWALQIPFLLLTLPLLWRLVTGRIGAYGFVNHPDFLVAVIVWGVTALLTVLLIVAQLVTQGRWGLTLGKLATGLRVVNVKTLAKPGFWRVTARAMVVWPLAITVVGPVVAFVSPLLARDRDRSRGWHDRVGDLWLVDSRIGLDPYDEKRMRIARKLVTASPAPRPKPLPSLATPEDDREPAGDYRPGARTSAGVLGVARPHRPVERVVVGLSGLEPAPVPSAREDTQDLGSPRLGGYLSSSADEPDRAPAAPVAVTTGALGSSPAPVPSAQAPQQPAAPRHLASSLPAQPAPEAPRQSTPPPSSEPAPEPAPVPGPAPSPRVVSLLFDTGDHFQLTSAVAVGRSPESVQGAHPMAIADPSSTISKTHVVLRPAPGGSAGVEVIDQSSTNGTVIVHDGHERKLAAGEIAVAEPGDTVRFGDRAARVLGS